MWKRRCLGTMVTACAMLGVVGCSGGGSSKAESDVLPPLSLACESDSECTGGQVCDPFTGCVECLFDAQCPAGSRCDARACVEAKTCAGDADCAGTVTPACDTASKVCVTCTSTSGCAQNQRCDDGACVVYSPCVNSRDCGAGQVCDREHGRCVQCVANGDCGENETCADYQCTPNCDSDRDCTALNLLCDPVAGFCSECVYAVDCPDVYHCAGGECVLDVCMAGESRCTGDPRWAERCSAKGDVWEPADCGLGASCQDLGGGTTACTPWVCQPGAVGCDDANAKLERCADDGLGYQAQTDCVAEGGVCEGSSCRDVTCDAGTAFCKDGSVYQCDGTGTSFTLVQACATGEFCDPSTIRCSPQACTPDAVYCDGDTVATCKSDGSGSTPGTDCSQSAQACFQGECLPIVCAGPSCVGNDVYVCSENGTASTLSQTCTAGEYCDADGGTCLPQVCVPGVASCDGDVAATCNSAGSGYDPGSDCAATGGTCYLGTCLPKLCDDGTTYCSGNEVRSCTNGGTASTLIRTCASYQYCSSGACNSLVCTPGQPVCNGQVATTCNANGSGYESAGTDCTTTGAACSAGACVSLVCQPDTYFCGTANDVRLCWTSGTSSTLWRTCYAGEYCTGGACKPLVCTPGQPVCNGNVLTTCNSDGLGYVTGGTDCSTTNSVCLRATCLPVICTDATYFCSGGNVFSCGNKGTTTQLYDTCLANEYCKDGTSSCQRDVCTAGSAVCNGTFVTTCKSDGSGPNAGGTDCALSGQTCDTGVCKAIVCPAGKTFCNAGNVDLCNAFGTASSRYTTCAAAQWCDDRTTATCAADVCVSSTAACDGEKLATCRADGGGFTSQTTDCSTTSTVCDLASGCVQAAVDVIGANTYSSSFSYGFFVADLVEVRTARKLTQIEILATVSGTSIFEYAVYSATTSSGPYTRIFDKVSTGSGTAVFQSSGDISVPLEAGKFYAIAVGISGNGSVAYTTAQPDYLSFGRSFSDYTDAYSTNGAPASITPYYYTAGYAWYERLTTTLP